MKIGILQTGRAPDDMRARHGDYDAMFERLLAGNGFAFATYPVLDGVFPQGVTDADGWLITGSKHGVYDGLDWIARLESFLRDAYADAVPIVGICFGHQLLAQALGGKVEKFSGGWSVGATDYDTADHGAERLVAWHQDQVIEPPRGATVLATGPGCRYAMLGYGNRAFSIQPHPEYDAAIYRDLLAARGDALPPDRRATALDGIDTALTRDRMADRIAAFFRASARQDA